VLILGVGLLYVYAEDASKNKTDKTDKAEVAVTTYESGSAPEETEPGSEASAYKPTKAKAVTANVSKFRPTDSALVDLAPEEETKSAE